MPKPELYVIYTGDRKQVPDTISLSKEFFAGEKISIDVEAQNDFYPGYPPKKWENSITRYSITEENLIGNVKEQKVNYDLMTAVMVFLGSPKGENYAGVLKLLEVLLSTETNPQEKKKILEEDFQIQMTQKLESEVSLMCNLSKGIEEKGIEKGMEKGKKEGLKEGLKEGIKNSILNLMKNMKLSIQEAMEVLDIQEADREEYMEMIKKTN